MTDSLATLTNVRPGIFQKIVFRVLQKLRYGTLILEEEGKKITFGGKQTDALSVLLTIRQSDVYRNVFFHGALGASKSYMAGHWETDDLTLLLRIFLQNRTMIEQLETPLAKMINVVRRVASSWRSNSHLKAKDNILRHYDLGNEFFELFLDSVMMYSCAIFDEKSKTLEQASLKKLSLICESLHIQPSDHILEIGTGWGGFALFAAKNFGCKVTTTTISDKQYEYVKNKVKKEGLNDRIEVLNKDYRNLTGKYDKVVSIEMIEAVGHRNLKNFFRYCNSLLKPNGLFFLQSIIIRDKFYESARREIDFIKKFIFPGGCLPSLQVISNCIATETDMQLMMLQDIGEHYPVTLKMWHDKFLSNTDTIRKIGFSEEFIRMWKYYFCYCSAGFSSRHISAIHALWKK